MVGQLVSEEGSFADYAVEVSDDCEDSLLPG